MQRNEFENIIKKINDSKLPSLHYLEDLDWFYGLKLSRVAEGLDIDKHRWYEISITVYKFGDLFLGISGPSQLYTESSSWEDLYVHCVAFEMEEVQSVTYKKK